MQINRRISTLASVLCLWSAGSLLDANLASAHVTVGSAHPTQGGYAVVTFRVPTESDTASTIGLRVALPANQPIASVSVQPHPGWSFTVKKRSINPPIKTDDGEVTEAVSEIDWHADDAKTAIKPGEFDQFNISAGPLPEVDSLTFKAIQTYSDGTVVSWIETPAPGSTAEPDHPAPVLNLINPAGDSAPSSSSTTAPAGPTVTATPASAADDAASKGTATTGIILGAIGICLGAAALGLIIARNRRRAS